MFPIKASKRKVAGAIAGATALAGLAVWIYIQRQPTIRPEFVGTWQAELYPENIKTLHSDGTFESKSLETNIRGYRNVEFRTKGKWAATQSSITYITKEEQAFQDGKPFPKIFEVLDYGPLPRRGVVEIRWDGRDRYYTQWKMGVIVRVSPKRASDTH